MLRRTTRADAVSTADSGLLPSPPHASHPPTPHRAPLHPTRPRPGPWCASGLASDTANPPFADGIVSPPHNPCAPLPRAPRHLPRQSASCAARSGGGTLGNLPRTPGPGESKRAPSPAPSAPRPSARSPFPHSFCSFFPGPPCPFLSPGPSVCKFPSPHPHRSPTLSSPPHCHTLSAPLCLLICLLIDKRGSAAPGGAQLPDPALPEHLESGRRRRPEPGQQRRERRQLRERQPDRGDRRSPRSSGRRGDVPAKAEQTPADQT